MVKEPVAADTVPADTVVKEPVPPFTVVPLIVGALTYPVLDILAYVMPVKDALRLTTSFMEWVCPERATLLPPTVIEENVPVDLVMAFYVTPDKAVFIAETDADTVAMFPLRVVREASRPVTCDMVWTCPSKATALPFTVNELASRVEKVTWSKSVAAYRSAPLYILYVSDVKYSLLD